MAADVRAQIDAVKAEFASRPEGLRAHVERVLVEAQELAAYWDLDPERVELATWGHDLFRSYSNEQQLQLAGEVGLKVRRADRAAPVVLHGPIAALVLRERFGIRDEDALSAVAEHTLGAPRMPLLSKVLLLSDKFERRKRDRTPLMRQIRQLARRDLDLALVCWADWKWVQEREAGWPGHPAHWRARQEWVRQHHREQRAPGHDSRLDR
jgi:predicted HD superfamily hydrolase involved in NAD metabolism